jgi:hypothetical protein
MLLKLILLIIGATLMGYGIWRAFGHEQPRDTIGALLALTGLVVALTGTVIICVPHFFR